MGINRRKKKGETSGKKPPSPKGKTERKEPTPDEVLRRHARQNERDHARKAKQAQYENLDFIVEGDLSPEDFDSLVADAKQEPVRGNYHNIFDAVVNHGETPDAKNIMDSFEPTTDIDIAFANRVLKEWRKGNREKLRKEKKAREEKKKKEAQTKRLAKAMGVSVEELQEPLSRDIIEDIMSILIVPSLEPQEFL